MRGSPQEKVLEEARAACRRVMDNVNRVVIGKEAQVELSLSALLSQGHMLVEDVPGVGKTTLTKALAKSVGCSFRRIQCTPDLLPSDIIGASIYNQKTDEFEFRPGPIMAQIVLVDEINRASPRTQAAFLECMEERQITVERVTYTMPRPFWVMATQSPIEYQGTFPLPETQVDRFFIRLHMGYPAFDDEVNILEQQREMHPIEEVNQAIQAEELLEVQHIVKQVYVDVLMREYMVRLVESTRRHPSVQLGASPRGSLALFRGAQALALLRGRDYVLPDDVKALTEVALAHRLNLTASARMKGVTSEKVMDEILSNVAVPGSQGPRKPAMERP